METPFKGLLGLLAVFRLGDLDTIWESGEHCFCKLHADIAVLSGQDRLAFAEDAVRCC